MKNRRSEEWYLLRVLCVLAAFTPNCTRCCPTGTGGCQTYWAWEDCPPQQGCGSCGGSGCTSCTTTSTNGALTDPNMLEDAQGRTQSFPLGDAAFDEAGGTLAFVSTAAGTFAVAAVGALDRVHIVRVTSNTTPEDPLTARTVTDVAFSVGDEPGRVIPDARGHALVALRRGGAIATIDPLTATVVERKPVCAAPRGMLLDAVNDVVHVSCASGEVVSFASDGVELRRVFSHEELRDLWFDGDSLVSSGGSREVIVSATGAISRRAPRMLGPFTTDMLMDVGVLGDTTAIATDGEARLRATPADDFVKIGSPGLAHAVALGDVAGDGTTRRIVAIQTVLPRMIVFFATQELTSPVALEPLE